MNTAARYALGAVLFFPVSTFAADDVTERAVPGLPSPLQRQVPIPVAPMSATTMEQQLAALQQQVQALQAQLAIIQAAVQVTSSGVTLQGPTVTVAGGMINLRAQNNVEVMAHATVTMRADRDLDFKAGNTASTDAGVNLSLRSAAGTAVQASGSLDLRGSTILLNGGTKPLATVGSQVQVPSSPIGQIVSGSPTIFGN